MQSKRQQAIWKSKKRKKKKTEGAPKRLQKKKRKVQIEPAEPAVSGEVGKNKEEQDSGPKAKQGEEPEKSLPPAQLKKEGEKEEKKEQKEEEKDEERDKILKIITAHLDDLNKTEEVISKYGNQELSKYKRDYTKVGYEPAEGNRCVTYNKEDEKTVHKTNLLTFIKADAEIAAQLSLENKDAVKRKLLKDAQDFLIDSEGQLMVPCFPAEHYVSAGDIALDHTPPQKDARKGQANLVELMNDDKSILDRLKKRDDFDKFFIEIPKESKKYYGTRYFYELGYNNVCALGLLCHVCNTKKSAKEIFDWMGTLELEDEFKTYLNGKSIELPNLKEAEKELEALNTKIAQAARTWLEERSRNIMKVYKEVEEFSLKLKAIAQKASKHDPKTGEIIVHAAVGVANKVAEGVQLAAKNLARTGKVKAQQLEEDAENLVDITEILTKSEGLKALNLEVKAVAGKELKGISKERSEAAFEAALEVAKAAIKPAMQAAVMLAKDDSIDVAQFQVKLSPLKDQVEALALESPKKSSKPAPSS